MLNHFSNLVSSHCSSDFLISSLKIDAFIMSEQIPGPAVYPVIGSLLELRSAGTGTAVLVNLANEYGPIFQFVRPGGSKTVVVSSVELLDELCDEKRFWKKPPAALENYSSTVNGPPGLFVARTDDHNWELAHRVLMPAFGPLPIQNMFDGKPSLCRSLYLSSCMPCGSLLRRNA